MNKDSSKASGMDDIAQQLSQWRQAGVDRLSPARFLFIETLAKRVGQHAGAPQRLLQERLLKHFQAYRDEVVEPARISRPGTDDSKLNQQAGQQGLKELLHHANRQAAQVSQQADAKQESAVPQHELSLDPALIDFFRNAWAKASANGMLRQAQARVPDNAGPLNSSSLAHRALMLMRAQSPGYLQHFLTYVDALSWLDQLNEAHIGEKPAAAKRKTGKRQA